MRRIIPAAVAAIIVLLLLSLSPSISSSVKLYLAELLSPLQSGTNYLFRQLGGTSSGIGRLIDTASRDKDLEERVESLTREVIRLKEAERENKVLRALLNLRDKNPSGGVAARVVGRDIHHWNQSILINKGGVDGIEKDDPVVSSGGLIGRIREVSPHLSRVLLITDPASGVGAVLQSSRLTGIVKGDSRGGCVISYLPRRVTINPGEKVLTSGLGRIYPSGLLIGTIDRVYRKRFGLYQTADLIPAASFDRLEEVMVINPDKGE